MLFSVVIPTYNRLSLLKRALDSVWAQTFANFEVIVVDDGSTDGTTDYLARMPNRLILLRQVNRGPGSARNFGVQYAKGQYLAFLDSDDLWFPWTLEAYMEIIRRERGPSIIAGKPHRFWTESELAGLTKGAIQIRRFTDYLASGKQWRWCGVSSFIIKREVFLAAGGFTEEWVNGEDADLMLKMGGAPGFIQITGPATFAYREHDASAVKNVELTVAGAWLKVRSERASRYPGGAARANERRRILTRHMRPLTLRCLQEGLRREAWALYHATFAWNAAEGRVKYLAGFPIVAAVSAFRASNIAGLHPMPGDEQD